MTAATLANLMTVMTGMHIGCNRDGPRSAPRGARKVGVRMTDEIRLELQSETKQVAQLRQALNWLLHLHHDIGRSGGPPDDNEWKEALEFAKKAMARTPAEPEPDVCLECDNIYRPNKPYDHKDSCSLYFPF